jgi:hypothetical protein
MRKGRMDAAQWDSRGSLLNFLYESNGATAPEELQWKEKV